MLLNSINTATCDTIYVLHCKYIEPIIQHIRPFPILFLFPASLIWPNIWTFGHRHITFQSWWISPNQYNLFILFIFFSFQRISQTFSLFILFWFSFISLLVPFFHYHFLWSTLSLISFYVPPPFVCPYGVSFKLLSFIALLSFYILYLGLILLCFFRFCVFSHLSQTNSIPVSYFPCHHFFVYSSIILEINIISFSYILLVMYFC